MDEIFLNRVIFEFQQEGNTDGTTGDEELMTIEMQSCTDSLHKEPGYLVLRTESGWSFNDIDEFVEMLNYVKNTLT